MLKPASFSGTLMFLMWNVAQEKIIGKTKASKKGTFDE